MISTKTALILAVVCLLILFGLYLFIVIREMRWKKQDAAHAHSEQLQQMMRLPVDDWPAIPPYQAHVNVNKDRSLNGKARVRARKAVNRGH